MTRWLQLPLYLGLILAQGIYVYHSWVELSDLIGLVLIANLFILMIVSRYEISVSRMHLQSHADQPAWLSHVNASVLKVKLATAMIGIWAMYLLKTFISASAYDANAVRINQHSHRVPDLDAGNLLPGQTCHRHTAYDS